VTAVTAFGRAMRDQWYLDPGITYLNHGTVGAPPRAVIAEQFRIVEEIERNPARFMLRELNDPLGRSEVPLRLRRAADLVAPFVGVEPGDDLLFVDNITSGVNAVLQSFPFDPADEIVTTSLGYGGITNAASFAARDRGCSFRTIELPGPGAPPAEFVERIADGLSASTRVLVVDHLTATTALVLPLREIAEACHANGTLVLADGAHVPGNVELDISSLGVDWYTGNLHKWAWTPRSSGILWAAPEQRRHLHPTVISWGLDLGLTNEFDLLGTRDPTAHLCAPFAVDLLHSYGEGVVMAYNHELAWWAGHRLAEAWRVPFTTPESMIGSMVTVPLPGAFDGDVDDALRLQEVLAQRGIEVPITATRAGFTVRVSAQIYCDRDDVERLATAVLELA
jgi:isopenicillin-N epimerase